MGSLKRWRVVLFATECLSCGLYRVFDLFFLVAMLLPVQQLFDQEFGCALGLIAVSTFHSCLPLYGSDLGTCQHAICLTTFDRPTPLPGFPVPCVVSKCGPGAFVSSVHWAEPCLIFQCTCVAPYMVYSGLCFLEVLLMGLSLLFVLVVGCSVWCSYSGLGLSVFSLVGRLLVSGCLL